ncbi:MAG: LptF/LptG family permease [Candidatus Wallacebacter cryptica]|jgi:lipopolysaccharide export system permease protein|nr:YjgP/YjgQ family permease [Bacillota bacterium]
MIQTKQYRALTLRGSAILDRYTLREFFWPFVFCVIGFTVILLSGVLFELIDLFLVKKVPIRTVTRMLIYYLPGIVVMTLPVAALFSTLLSLGRLNQDSEMIVMRSSGLPYWRIMIPVVAAALLISGATYLLNEEVVPWTNHEFQKLFRELIYQEDSPLIEENVFFLGGENRYFYINEVNKQHRILRNILVYETEPDGFPRLITANSGTYRDNFWYLEDGLVQNLDEDGYVSYQTRFETMQIVTPDSSDLYFGNQKTSDEMSRKELKEHIDRFQRSGLKVLSFVVDYHLKLALPMASFIFVLFAAPLSLFSKSSKSFGIAVSLVVTLLYYVATPVCRSLAINEVIPPLAAAWLTNSIFALTGIVLLIRADRLH